MPELQTDLPDDGLGRLGTRPARRRLLLLVVAAAETLSLVVLLVNLVSATRSSALAAALGPVHGGLYLAGVLLTWTAPFSRALKIAAIVPVAGAWLAALQPDHRGRSSTRPPERPRSGRAR